MEKKLAKVSDLIHISYNQFNSIKDDDVKKYIYNKGIFPSQYNYERTFENDEKIAFYYFIDRIKRNKLGNFYVKGSLHQWIVYYKNSGKIKTSSDFSHIKVHFIEQYFEDPNVLFKIIPPYRVTKTFIKRVIENKINNYEDVLKYIRSYIIKNTKVPLTAVLDLCLHSIPFTVLDVFEDPENFKINTEFTKNYSSIMELSNYKYFKVKFSDLGNIRKRIKSYEQEQSQKVIEI